MTRRPIAVALVLMLVATACGRSSPVDRAIATVNDDDRFSTGAESAQSVGRVADIMRNDGDECIRDHDARDPRCEARLAASAYAQVLAVVLLDCTTPDRDEARLALTRYLRAVGRVGEDGEPPPTPFPPRCTA